MQYSLQHSQERNNNSCKVWAQEHFRMQALCYTTSHHIYMKVLGKFISGDILLKFWRLFNY